MRATLLECRPITARDTLYLFHCPQISTSARPGQFVEVKITDGYTPFLRRPISIFDADGAQAFSLLVRTVGEGTKQMSCWSPGTEVDVLGPLGNGFSWGADTRTCVLVAGGIGLAPLSFLSRQLLRAGIHVHLLFAPGRDAALLEQLPQGQGLNVLCAENRSAVGTMLPALLAQAEQVFACGPEGLLELVAHQSTSQGVACQLSMERRMACGFGICLGCAIAVRERDALTYKKVCKDGPVFRAEEVAFHEKP